MTSLSPHESCKCGHPPCKKCVITRKRLRKIATIGHIIGLTVGMAITVYQPSRFPIVSLLLALLAAAFAIFIRLFGMRAPPGITWTASSGWVWASSASAHTRSAQAVYNESHFRTRAVVDALPSVSQALFIISLMWLPMVLSLPGAITLEMAILTMLWLCLRFSTIWKLFIAAGA